MNQVRWQQIDNILLTALELEPAERTSFIEQACAGDESLQQEVMSLLSFDEQALNLDTPAFEAAACILARGPSDLAEGQQVGHYWIISLLGIGGMGEVYLAEDTRLSRKIALKLLPAAFTTDRGRVRRFQQEARAASALNHPNIITIYETGEFQGRHFIATEYIDGETLRQRMHRTTLNLSETLDIAVQVASALAAAHQAGIVHRDIKPENIMLRLDGYVKMLDFGLAKLLEQRSPDGDSGKPVPVETDTMPGLLMGTAKYMSPEQARGLKLDVRSDIFSLGVVIYEMLAGRVPFEGETRIDVVASLLKEDPAPLSQFVSDLPVELEQIISKALAKNRDERYQTVNEMLAAIKEFRQQLEVDRNLKGIKRIETGASSSAINAATASDLSFGLRTASFTRKNMLPVGLVLLMMAAIVGLVIYNLNRQVRTNTGALNELYTAEIKAGDLDLRFGTSGIVITQMSQQGGNDEIMSIAVQSDGRIVAVGPAWRGETNKDFGLARYNPDGTLDDTFGTGGKVITNLSNINNEDIPFAAVLQPDGRIVAAGFAFNGSEGPDFALARFNTDGSLDTSFGAGGKVTTPLGGDDKALGLVIQQDGKIVAAGHASTNFALVRYNTDGSLDTSFGKAGKVITDISAANTNNNAQGFAIQPDGRLVASGFVFNSSTGGDTTLVRYNTDGSLDTSFGTGGKVIINLSPVNGHDHALEVAIQPDNKIVAVGDVNNGSTGRDFTIIRLNSDGRLDTSYGTGGIVTTDIDGQDNAYAIALQLGGRIIAAGYCADNRDFALVRYNADGSLDTSFGAGGKVTANISPVKGNDVIYFLALQPDGRLIAAGAAYNGTDNDFGLAMFDARLPNAAP
jgi:uncharacterized delta-60 repeat protein